MARSRDAVLFLLCAVIVVLGSVLVGQYGFGLAPCPLCVYQRIPHIAVGVVAALFLTARPGGRAGEAVLALCALLFAASAAVAAYHVGVEQHWWPGPSSCSSSGAAGAQSVEDLMARLSGPVRIVACDQIPWSLFGISLAGYNLLVCLALTVFSVVSARAGARGEQ